VDQWVSVGARRRPGGRLRSWRSPPAAAERILARGLPRTGLIPWSPHSVPGARRLRAVRTIGARRHPAPVRQPVLAPGHRPAVRRAPGHRPAVRRPPVQRTAVRGARGHRTAVARRAVGREAVGRICGRRREATRRRPHARTARLERPFPGASQQLAVLVVVVAVRPVRPRVVVWPVGAAITQASSPGQAIGIAAQAGVATFHQVPPGLVTQPRRRTCLTSRV
jgi:hypothetical protein